MIYIDILKLCIILKMIVISYNKLFKENENYGK